MARYVKVQSGTVQWIPFLIASINDIQKWYLTGYENITLTTEPCTEYSLKIMTDGMSRGV